MIYGLGTDIVEVSRLGKKLQDNEALKRKTFSEAEIAYCEGKKKWAEHFAARFAAKEAFFKALGTGWIGQCKITDVEVINEENGNPNIRLSGQAIDVIKAAGVQKIHLSLSHVAETAIAVVILEA